MEQEQQKRARSEAEARALHRVESDKHEEELPFEEVIRRLRLLGQPVTLFGEVSSGTNVSALGT